MLQRIDALIQQQTPFVIETTLTIIGYLKERVMLGGHNIPADIIERRYKKGLQNLPKFIAAVNDWYLYDNSGSHYEDIAKTIVGEKEITNFELFLKIIGDAGN